MVVTPLRRSRSSIAKNNPYVRSVRESLVAPEMPRSAATMPSLIASRDTTGQPIAAPNACASVVLPDPGGPVTRIRPGWPTRSGPDLRLLWGRLQHADALQLVGRARPRRRRRATGPSSRSTGADLAGCCRPAPPLPGELPNADRGNVSRMLSHELAVDRFVVLPVITEQQPLDGGNSLASRSSMERLCSRPLRNQRSAVGPQSVSSRGPAG